MTEGSVRLLSVVEAASVLGVSKEQVLQWFLDGTLPYVLVGRDRRTSVLMITEWQRRAALATQVRRKEN